MNRGHRWSLLLALAGTLVLVPALAIGNAPP